jgi:hypothetical protein
MSTNQDDAAHRGDVTDGPEPESYDPRLHASVERLTEAIEDARQVLEDITGRLRAGWNPS